MYDTSDTCTLTIDPLVASNNTCFRIPEKYNLLTVISRLYLRVSYDELQTDMSDLLNIHWYLATCIKYPWALETSTATTRTLAETIIYEQCHGNNIMFDPVDINCVIIPIYTGEVYCTPMEVLLYSNSNRNSNSNSTKKFQLLATYMSISADASISSIARARASVGSRIRENKVQLLFGQVLSGHPFRNNNFGKGRVLGLFAYTAASDSVINKCTVTCSGSNETEIMSDDMLTFNVFGKTIYLVPFHELFASWEAIYSHKFQIDNKAVNMQHGYCNYVIDTDIKGEFVTIVMCAIRD